MPPAPAGTIGSCRPHRPRSTPPPDLDPGTAVLRADLVGTVAFVVTSVAAAAFLRPLGAGSRDRRLGRAVRRRLPGIRVGIPRRRRAEPHRGDRAVVAVLPQGQRAPAPGAPGPSRPLAAQVVVAAIATAAGPPFTSLAFGVLAPVWGLGMITLWSGRTGPFRRSEPTPRRPPAWSTRRRPAGTGRRRMSRAEGIGQNDPRCRWHRRTEESLAPTEMA